MTFFYRSILFLFFSVGFLPWQLSAQEIVLSGTVSDSLKKPLSFVNMIAVPISNKMEMSFAISDRKGKYELKLKPKVAYRLAITHLGFSRLVDTIQFSKSTSKNFTLYRTTETLEKVLIKAEIPIIVKKDTITYRVDNFRTGEERKLRELLKNLPGVEVDRAGNVKVNGQKVTKLLVEGKTFFTGDEKLGVNNIPADAVEEVTVLDDYHEVAFMKGLSESNQMALNIKLKEGMKKFVFGNIEVGAGIEERYLVHPTLFYYSPKTAVNVIADLNNIGEKSFTVQDYIDFEGGIFSADYSLYNSDFARFLSQRNFIFQKNEFGALSISQELAPNLRLTGYSINSFGKTKTKTTQEITYLTEDQLTESRLNTMTNDLFFSLNKLELKYNPDYQTDLKYETIVKLSTGDTRQFISSETSMDTNMVRTLTHPKSVKVTQNLEFKKQFSYKHTSELNLNYTYQQNENTKDWLFDQAVFSGIIPFVDEGESYNLFQNTSSITNQVQFRLKHYWVLNNFNHIYPVVGATFLHQTYGTLDYQVLQDGSINSFQNSGFNNDLNYQIVDTYFGFEYKRKLGKLILKPGLVYHYFLWNIAQGTEITNKTKAVLLPKLSAEIELPSGENFHFDYSMQTSFSDVSSYANRLRLASFNQLYRGNENLENNLYHQLSLRFYQFNLFSGNFVHAGVNYTKRVKSVQNTTMLDGIDQISTPIYTELPQNSFSMNGSYSKRVGKLKFSLSGNASWSDYSRIINKTKIKYNSENYSYSFKTETDFEKWPNVEVGFKQSFSIFQSENMNNGFMNLNPYAFLEYDFGNFIFKTNYSYNYYQNKNTGQINRFQIGDASLFYGKPDSLWGFELSVKNIFDVRYKNQNSFGQFLVTDRNIYIQPRTVLFKISYKI